MKVEEAEEKECRQLPYSTRTFYDPAGFSAIETIPACCSGDKCAHWRWFDTNVKNEGYCGLAGKEGAE